MTGARGGVYGGGTATAFPTLLSQVLIAFTIEHDNEFERQIMASPYRPFLTSIVMWDNFLRFVPVEGITA
ncbi:MAG TPA: hypothetical protein VM840_02105 [Actinomycetota bacterium]|nr:hypothetical protein [Actinomycetota bacterium]